MVSDRAAGRDVYNRIPAPQDPSVLECVSYHEGCMTRTLMLALSLAVSLATVGAAQAPVTPVEKETGLAAVYTDTLKGHTTASGQTYDPTKLTAAHKTLPSGTTVRVTNTKNHKNVVLRIADRGPKQAARVLDISPAAADRLEINRRGMGEVTVEVVALGSGKRALRLAR
jgi:rare lipoprotein A